MSKHERRQRFEAQVKAQDEMAAELQKYIMSQQVTPADPTTAGYAYYNTDPGGQQQNYQDPTLAQYSDPDMAYAMQHMQGRA